MWRIRSEQSVKKALNTQPHLYTHTNTVHTPYIDTDTSVLLKLLEFVQTSQQARLVNSEVMWSLERILVMKWSQRYQCGSKLLNRQLTPLLQGYDISNTEKWRKVCVCVLQIPSKAVLLSCRSRVQWKVITACTGNPACRCVAVSPTFGSASCCSLCRSVCMTDIYKAILMFL